jgi:hypothetical protein
MSAYSLYIWAKDDPDRKQKLKDWLDSAIEAMGSSNGKEVINTSANGINVAFSGNVTTGEWVDKLSDALRYFEDGGPITKTVATFR